MPQTASERADKATTDPALRGSDELRIWLFLCERGEVGATDDEIEVNLGISRQVVTARRLSLAKKGKVKDSGAKRQTRRGSQAVVWIAGAPAPIVDASKAPVKPTREVVLVAIDEINNLIRTGQVLNPDYQPSPQLQKLGQWLRSQAKVE